MKKEEEAIKQAAMQTTVEGSIRDDNPTPCNRGTRDFWKWKNLYATMIVAHRAHADFLSVHFGQACSVVICSVVMYSVVNIHKTNFSRGKDTGGRKKMLASTGSCSLMTLSAGFWKMIYYYLCTLTGRALQLPLKLPSSEGVISINN